MNADRPSRLAGAISDPVTATGLSTLLAVAGALAVGAASGSALRGLVAGLAAGALVWIAREPRFGLAAILVAIPLDQFGVLVDQPVVVTAYQVMLLATLASWGWRVARARARVRWSRIDLGTAAMVFAAAWSLPFSMARSATAVSIVRLAFLAVLVLLVENLVDDIAWAKRLAGVFALSAVATAVIADLQFTIVGFPIPMQYGDLASGAMRAAAFFKDPNFLGAFMCVALTVFLAVAVHSRRRTGALVWLAAAAVCGTGLAVTFSRGAWVAAVAGFVVVALTAPPRRRTTLVVAGLTLAIAAAILAPASLRDRALSVFDIKSDPSMSTRYDLIGSSLEMARDHPVFGVGLGAFDKAYPAYRAPGTGPVVKPHEVAVSFVAQTGIAGLLALVLVVAGLVAEICRRRGTTRSDWGGPAVAGLVALGVSTLFQNLLYFEYLWLFVGFAVVSGRLASAGDEAIADRTAGAGARALRVAVCGIDPESAHFLTYTRYLASCGHDVTAVTNRNEVDAPVKAVNFARHSRLIRVVPPGVRALVRAARLRGALRDGRYDVVSIQQMTPDGVFAALLSPAPVVITFWGSDILQVSKRAWYVRRLMPKAVRRAAAVHATSEEIAQRALAMGADPARLQTFNYGIDLMVFTIEGDEAREPARILCTRGMRPFYRTDMLLRAMPMVLEAAPDARLVLAGTGSPEASEAARALADELGLADRVEFPGQIDAPRVASELRRAAVWASIPPTDSFALSLQEAMACGAFPVVTDLPSMRQGVSEKTAILLADVTPAKVAAALLEAMERAPSGAHIEANRATVERVGDRSVNLARFERLVVQAAGVLCSDDPRRK